MSEWISVDDQIPVNGDKVLVFINHGDTTRMESWEWDRFWKMNNATHWMPLPEPPKGEDHG